MMFTDTDRSLGDFKTHIRARSSENYTQLFRLLVADLNSNVLRIPKHSCFAFFVEVWVSLGRIQKTQRTLSEQKTPFLYLSKSRNIFVWQVSRNATMQCV